MRLYLNHVAAAVGPPVQIFGIEHVHRGRRSTAHRRGRRGQLRRQGISAEALEAAVEHHVRLHVLQRGESRLGHVRRRVLGLDALDCLERIQVILVHHVVGDDEVGIVPAPDQLDPERVHLLEDGARTQHRQPVGRRRPRLVLPERPHAAVNAAHRAAGWSSAHEELQAADGVGYAAVAVDALGKAVHEGIFGIHTFMNGPAYF